MPIALGAKPPAHKRVTFEGVFGTIAAPIEQWSFRLNLNTDSPGTGTVPTALATLASAYTSHVRQHTTALARLTRVKYAEIGADGAYTSDPVLLDVDIPGTNVSTPNMPLQIALSISLNTALRGPTRRGRIFLPAPGFGTLTASGLIVNTAAQAIATGMKNFLDAINAEPQLGRVVIASSAGYLTNVTGVRVGVVPDTIRSRREKLSEAYGATLAVVG
jgi:hypothetical protein